MVHLTHSTKPISDKEIKREWHLFNLKNKVLGRTVTEIVRVLQGKQKVSFATYLDQGDYVVVINAAKVTITGQKANTKEYTRYSGYSGGLKKTSYKELLNKNPEKIIRHAVSGMLPKNKHRDQRLGRLFVYNDETHPYKDKFKEQN